jgi:tetratricopeptide (TPR) repeat protein
VAKEAWNYAVANSPPGLLSALDGAVLERWANCSGLYREALAGRKEVLGDMHPNTGDTAYNLAILLKNLGKLEEAAELYELAASAYEAAYGPDHSETADARKQAAACA